MVRKLLHQFPVKVWAKGSVLVHVDANWKDTDLKINRKKTQLFVQVDAFIPHTGANYIGAVPVVVLGRDVTGAQSGLWRRSWNG